MLHDLQVDEENSMQIVNDILGKPKEIAGVECCKVSESLMIQQMYQVWYHTEAPPSAPFAKTIPF